MADPQQDVKQSAISSKGSLQLVRHPSVERTVFRLTVNGNRLACKLTVKQHSANRPAFSSTLLLQLKRHHWAQWPAVNSKTTIVHHNDQPSAIIQLGGRPSAPRPAFATTTTSFQLIVQALRSAVNSRHPLASL